MAGTYQTGEEKIRPGVYRKYETPVKETVAGAMTGVFAIPVKADFGPLDTVTVHTKADTVSAMYGNGGTVKGALNLFEGGAQKVYVYRLGTGGSTGKLELKDGEDAAVVSLETKYPSPTAFSVTLKRKLGFNMRKEFSVYEGAVLKEKMEYDVPENGNEVAIFAETVNKKSSIFTAAKKTEESKQLAEIVQEPITAGTESTVTNEDYSTAFDAFEAYKWNILVADTVDTGVHTLMKAYMDRIKKNGSVGACVIGEGTNVSFEDRLSHAKECNCEYVIYVGSGFVDMQGNNVDGYEAVTLQAGVIGSTPTNQSIVHKAIPNAVDVIEVLKDEEYIDAINHGLLLLSPSEDGQVWFDSGVNTLTVPAENQDAGWKKVRRMMTRYEIFDRIDRTITPLIGRVNCDSDGIAAVIKAAKDVLDEMVNEKKLMVGADFFEDKENPHGTDDVRFVIKVTDLDSLEKVYLNYQFSFGAAE